MRIVRNRSIPNVTTERLIGDRDTLHHSIHTADGLHAFDGPRRNLIDLGVKLGKINSELHNRGEPSSSCRWCRR